MWQHWCRRRYWETPRRIPQHFITFYLPPFENTKSYSFCCLSCLKRMPADCFRIRRLWNCPRRGCRALGSGHCTDLRSMNDFGFHAKSNKSFGEHEWSNEAQAFHIHTCINCKRNAELGCRPSQSAVTAHSKGALFLRCTAPKACVFRVVARSSAKWAAGSVTQKWGSHYYRMRGPLLGVLS